MDLIKYYSNKKVQEFLLNISKNREVAVKFQDNFGKRPDTLQFENDVLEFVKKGATSFHISEEHWSNPLLLKSGMTKSQLDSLRTGWDLILDIDGPLEYSKITSHLISEALQFHDVENFTVKFSGNRGFHIAIPFNAFPDSVDAIKTKDLFPEGPKVIASYLKEMIKDELTAQITEKIPEGELKDYKKENKFDPFSVVDIDTILISNRHMFRAPYSINEKSGLISIPINKKNILNFDKEQATPENISFNEKFLSECKNGESSKLIIQAFDWNKKLPQKEITISRQYQEITQKIPMELFPSSIKKGLLGLEDGRKRFLFVLLNFLRSLNYDYGEIEKIIYEWNKKNREQLKEGYIKSQLLWHKRQDKILPPNFSNKVYYDDIGLKPKENELKFKNPVNYSLSLLRAKHR